MDKDKGASLSEFLLAGWSWRVVSNSGVDPVKNYILRQKEHHLKISAADEHKKLLDE